MTKEPREVIAALLESWQGDEAGTFDLADRILSELRRHGHALGVVTECVKCGEEIDPFCVRHGWNGSGVDQFFREAFREGYMPVDLMMQAIGGIQVGQEALTPGDRKIPVACDLYAFLRKTGPASDQRDGQ